MHRLVFLLLILGLPGCGGGPTDERALGSLVVRTETFGDELDPDGYTLTLDGQAPRPIGLADSIVVEDIAAGEHTVELGGLAANCQVLVENPLSVFTAAAIRTDVTFNVTCLGPNGTVTVRTFTSGTGGSVDGFVVRVDGTETRAIERNGAVAFIVPAGSHEILLEGLTDECAVDGDNPQIVSVGREEAVRVTFIVNCTP